MSTHEDMLPLRNNLGRDGLATKPLYITLRADRSLQISTEDDIHFMIKEADVFIKNDRKSVPIQTNAFYRHAKALFKELLVHRLKQSETNCRLFRCFWKPNSAKIIPFHLIMSYFHQCHTSVWPRCKRGPNSKRLTLKRGRDVVCYSWDVISGLLRGLPSIKELLARMWLSSHCKIKTCEIGVTEASRKTPKFSISTNWEQSPCQERGQRQSNW